MSAHNYGLDNLCAVIDRNHLQISGNTEDVMKQDSQAERWKAFGWNVIEVQNGNSIPELEKAFAGYTRMNDRCLKYEEAFETDPEVFDLYLKYLEKTGRILYMEKVKKYV